ncbi:MAG: VWA domain-containing protein [Kofleriaceae bacterium]
MQRIAAALAFALTACGAQGADGLDSGEPGGNVSFGGAQDIGEFRGALDRGELPAANSLDANGFFNEHFNAPPSGGCDSVLCLTPGLSIGRDWLTGHHQATIQISLNTSVDPASFPRLPMRLVVVVDHSGSMSSDGRLEKVKVGLHALVDNLQPEDRLAIISFDDDVTYNAPFSDALEVSHLHEVIDQLQPDGGTNLYDGLEAGFELIGEAPSSETQNRVIFLSDGLATVGITSSPAIMDMATEHIRTGIGLTTIGVGNNFDVELMRGLAENGAGTFYFLEDGTAATEVFQQELDYFMSPLALDVQLEAIAGAGWQFDEVVGTRRWSATSSRGDMDVPAVFLASRTSQEPTGGRRGGGSTLFIHLHNTSDASPDVADIRLSYRLPNSTERITQRVELDYSADPSATPDDPFLSSPEMAERYAMYNLYLGIRAATVSSDRNCAASALVATQQRALAWNETHQDPDIAADLMLIEQYLGNLRERGAVDRELAGCSFVAEPYEPEYGEHYCGVDQYDRVGCSAGKDSVGWLAIGLLSLRLRRRRRSR